MTEAFTRRELVRRGGAGAGALSLAGLLASCGTQDSTTTKTTSGRPGGTLVVGAIADAYMTKGADANLAEYPLNANVFEGLTRMGPDYAVLPALATRWSYRGHNTWRFQLRRGVRFHDGTPFTAKAVKQTFDRIAANGGGTPGFEAKGIKVVDDFTIDITPKFPNLRLPEQIVQPENSIIAPGSDLTKNPVGTGPFRFVDYRREERLRVRRNERYWGRKALLDGVTFRFFPEDNARRLALEAGDVMLALEVSGDAVAELRGRGMSVATSPIGAYEAFYCNFRGKGGAPALRDVAVRQALGLAIDRNALVKGVLPTVSAAEQTVIPARLLGPENARAVTGYAHDPGRAGQLLDQAGWKTGSDGMRAKGGQQLSLRLVDGFPSSKAHGAVPEFLQAQLRKVGVDVSIVKVADSAAYTDLLNAGKGDLWLEQGHQNDANPAFLPALLFSSKGAFNANDYLNLFEDKGRFETIIDQALSSPDPAQAKAKTAQAMHQLIDVDAVVIPLAGVRNVDALVSKVGGYESQPSALQTRYDKVSIA